MEVFGDKLRSISGEGPKRFLERSKNAGQRWFDEHKQEMVEASYKGEDHIFIKRKWDMEAPSKVTECCMDHIETITREHGLELLTSLEDSWLGLCHVFLYSWESPLEIPEPESFACTLRDIMAHGSERYQNILAQRLYDRQKPKMEKEAHKHNSTSYHHEDRIEHMRDSIIGKLEKLAALDGIRLLASFNTGYEGDYLHCRYNWYSAPTNVGEKV
jgi:hypothetical protein